MLWGLWVAISHRLVQIMIMWWVSLSSDGKVGSKQNTGHILHTVYKRGYKIKPPGVRLWTTAWHNHLRHVLAFRSSSMDGSRGNKRARSRSIWSGITAIFAFVIAELYLSSFSADSNVLAAQRETAHDIDGVAIECETERWIGLCLTHPIGCVRDVPYSGCHFTSLSKSWLSDTVEQSVASGMTDSPLCQSVRMWNMLFEASRHSSA